MKIKNILSILISVFYIANLNAQKVKDSIIPKSQTIKVKSSFKPVLRNANKQTFFATTPIVDSTRPRFNYVIPAQNLFFNYQPVPLKPLALQVSNNYIWENSNYLKVGFGNLSTPFISTGISLSDGKSSTLGIFGDYISSKGKIKFQDYSKLNIAFQGAKNTSTGFEFKGKLNYNLDQTNLYGFNHNLFSYSKNDVHQRFQTISISAGVRNAMPTEYGINYNPTIKSSLFADNNNGTETNINLTVPISKFIGKTLGFKLGGILDYSNYKKTGTSINNTLIYFTPAVLIKSAKANINVGISPTWENSKLSFLPDITASFDVKQDKKLVALLGWLGYFNKGSYQNLVNFNPYINQPNQLPNSKVNEIFAGFKGTSGNHFLYSLKAGLLNYTNMPLFINDTFSGNSFNVIYESKLQNFQIHAEFGVIEKEIFHFTAGATFNSYTGIQDNLRAWGLLPIELTGSLRWRIAKAIELKSDAFIWNGADFKTKTNTIDKMNFVLDLNAGIEFKVAKQFNVWFQANNLLNSTYQRWRNYETYGINFLGGVKYTFTSKAITKFSKEN